MKIKPLTLATFIALTSFNSVVSADNLLQIYETAKLQDPIIQKSKAQYDMYLEKISTSNAALLPQIGFGLNAAKSKDEDDLTSNTNYGANLALSQSLYNGSYWKELDLAEIQATQFEAIYGYAQQNLMIRTSVAYFNILRAHQSVQSVQANKRAVARQLEQTKQRFDVGLIAITDVHEAQAEYDRTNADLIKAKNKLINSYYALRELTGKDIRDIDLLNTDTFSAPPLQGDVTLWHNNALEHNLLLHEKRIAKDLAQMQIKLARTGHEPTLDLSASIGYNNTDYDMQTRPDIDMSNASIGLEFNLPIYTGGRTNSLVEQAKYSYVMASADLVQSFRSIDADIKSGYNNVRASISSITAYEQTVISSKSALEATEAGFDVGTRTIVDVLDSTKRLFDSEDLLANARYDYILSRLQLKYSAGTLSMQDIKDVSAGLISASSK
ncbi:outer membrane channel protein [Psychromonas sp. PRT-SC03]|nr:outer membrane channel protein [Psychromonas sp. PRT-SC03]